MPGERDDPNVGCTRSSTLKKDDSFEMKEMPDNWVKVIKKDRNGLDSERNANLLDSNNQTASKRIVDSIPNEPKSNTLASHIRPQTRTLREQLKTESAKKANYRSQQCVLMVAAKWSLPQKTLDSVSYINRQIAIWISKEAKKKVYSIVANRPSEAESRDAEKNAVKLISPDEIKNEICDDKMKGSVNDKLAFHQSLFPKLTELKIGLIICHATLDENTATAEAACTIRDDVLKKSKLITVVHGIPEDNKMLELVKQHGEEVKLLKYGKESSLVFAVGERVKQHLENKFKAGIQGTDKLPEVLCCYPAPDKDIIKTLFQIPQPIASDSRCIRILTIGNSDKPGTHHRQAMAYGMKQVCEVLRCDKSRVNVKWVKCGQITTKDEILHGDLDVIPKPKQFFGEVTTELCQSSLLLPHIEPGDEFNILVLHALSIGLPLLLPEYSQEASFLHDVCKESNTDLDPVISSAIGVSEMNLSESGQRLGKKMLDMIAPNQYTVSCKKAKELRENLINASNDGPISKAKEMIISHCLDLLEQISRENFERPNVYQRAVST